MQKLSAKQEQFCREYLVDLNATQAAIRAGYSPKTAYSMGQRLLKNVEVQKTVQSAMDERSKRTEVNADYVLTNLLEIVERCMQRAPVLHKGEQVVDEEGNSVWCFDGKNAIRALELLGKHLGMFTDKLQTEHSGGISITWEKE
jgi:phage terminase small subunit